MSARSKVLGWNDLVGICAICGRRGIFVDWCDGKHVYMCMACYNMWENWLEKKVKKLKINRDLDDKEIQGFLAEFLSEKARFKLILT